MASRRSEPQSEERPVVEDDGRTSRDEDYALRHSEDRGETYGDPDVLLDVPTLNVEAVDLEVVLAGPLHDDLIRLSLRVLAAGTDRRRA